MVRPARPELRKTEHDKEQKAAIPGPLPFVWIETSRIQLRKKHRPGFLSESRATGSVKLMFYANGQLLELVDETGVDSGDGSLVISASDESLVIGVHVVAGTAVDERALGERIFVTDGEGVALNVVSSRGLIFGIHVADENLGRTAEGGNVSTNGKTEAVKLTHLLHILNHLDGKVRVLEVLRGDVELGNAEVVVTTEADGQGIFNVLLAEGLEVSSG